jgi:glycosyltransferase involved in cell wall biosynthesis
MQKLRVLIVSENATNEFGGEAILPLNYFLLLSKRNVETYLLTHERVRRALEKIEEIDQTKVMYMPDNWLYQWLNAVGARLPHRLNLISAGALMYCICLCYQWVWAKRIIKQKNINIVHQPNPVSPKLPSMLFGLNAPVIIGPMNGGMTFPVAFEKMSTKAELCLYGILRVASNIFNLLMPGKFFANTLLVANERSKRALPFFYLGQVKQLVENGVFSTIDFKKPRRASVVTVLFVGRLVDWKAVDILIEAVHRCENVNLQLKIVGDGPELAKLQQFTDQLAMKNVTFCGYVPFAKISTYYDEADVFALPSVRECGGAVVLEAMSRGLPVVATNWGGPADYISPQTGFLVDPESREAMVEGFKVRLLQLAENAELREQMGVAAIAHVKSNFMWDDKVDQIIDLYHELV